MEVKRVGMLKLPEGKGVLGEANGTAGEELSGP